MDPAPPATQPSPPPPPLTGEAYTALMRAGSCRSPENEPRTVRETEDAILAAAARHGISGEDLQRHRTAGVLMDRNSAVHAVRAAMRDGLGLHFTGLSEAETHEAKCAINHVVRALDLAFAHMAFAGRNWRAVASGRARGAVPAHLAMLTHAAGDVVPGAPPGEEAQADAAAVEGLPDAEAMAGQVLETENPRRVWFSAWTGTLGPEATAAQGAAADGAAADGTAAEGTEKAANRLPWSGRYGWVPAREALRTQAVVECEQTGAFYMVPADLATRVWSEEIAFDGLLLGRGGPEDARDLGDMHDELEKLVQGLEEDDPEEEQQQAEQQQGGKKTPPLAILSAPDARWMTDARRRDIDRVVASLMKETIARMKEQSTPATAELDVLTVVTHEGSPVAMPCPRLGAVALGPETLAAMAATSAPPVPDEEVEVSTVFE
ncbi:MAG: hypothetical protein VYE81_06650 [Planctomycetota bacterium]|nr:hypothetical protein [Planctomycetota bacterium]